MNTWLDVEEWESTSYFILRLKVDQITVRSGEYRPVQLLIFYLFHQGPPWSLLKVFQFQRNLSDTPGQVH